MAYLDVGGCNLYYEDHSGPENAATLIFLHGAAGNHISWWQQIPYFSKKYRCITIDHRGFCWSEDKTQEGGSRFVEDLKLLLDEETSSKGNNSNILKLAVRSLNKLPISSPLTTGVKKTISGGILYKKN